MINGIIGIKKGMTEFFTDSGEVIPTTVIEAGPCYIIDKKTVDRDGYNSLKLAFGEIKPQRSSRAMSGVFKKAGVPPMKVVREFRDTEGNYDEYKIGDEVGVDLFKEGDHVDVTSSSKGKGFSGVMKRYNFAGQPDSHGGMAHRRPGSVGQHSYPGRVWKGMKMAGHYGAKKVTLQGLQVLKADKENNYILVKGSVPGPNNSYVVIKHTSKGN